jgi:hypothetical protein
MASLLTVRNVRDGAASMGSSVDVLLFHPEKWDDAETIL